MKKRSMKDISWRTYAAAAALICIVVFLYMRKHAGTTSSRPANLKLEKLSLEQKAKLTNDQWKQYLPPEVYTVIREKGTEIPFTGDLLNNHRKGTYVTADCGVPVFRSEAKFESGTGWPSFWQPIERNTLELIPDYDIGVERLEVVEKTCGSHLGHVFDDGPEPTGKRYCINSVALRFVPD